jgi:hypothetical protein
MSLAARRPNHGLGHVAAADECETLAVEHADLRLGFIAPRLLEVKFLGGMEILRCRGPIGVRLDPRPSRGRALAAGPDEKSRAAVVLAFAAGLARHRVPGV